MPKRINTTDYIKKTIAERLENAYKFECRCCKDKFDTRTDFFITANYLTVWEKFPEGEMQMYCSKYCANEESWTNDHYTENNYIGHYACNMCDCVLNKYKDPYYTAELIPECDDEIGRKWWYCMTCEEVAEEHIKDKTTRNLEFHNEDKCNSAELFNIIFGEVIPVVAEKEGIGFCSDCREELVEGYYWSRPDRNLKFCADCGEWVLNEEEEDPDNLSNFERMRIQVQNEDSFGEVLPVVVEKAKCPKCDNHYEPDGKCFDCEIAKCPDSDFDKTYIVRCGSQRSFEYGDETIMYNGNDFPEAVRVFEELNGKYKSKYEWVELYDNETYAIIKMWDRDSEAYQEDKKGSRKVSKKFPPKTEKEIKERENKYAEVAAEVKEKYGKMTNKQLYEFLVENRKTVKTPKGQTKDVYLSALVALTMYGDLYKYRDSIGGFITLPKYRTA